MTSTQNIATTILPSHFDSARRLHFSQQLQRYRDYIQSFGLAPGSSESEAMDSFDILSFDRQESLQKDLEITIEHIEELAPELSPLFAASAGKKLPKAMEFKSLEKMLSRRRLRFADASVLDTIDDGDIFEVYDSQGVQLYRSWSCYEYCFYNLVDLQVYSWDTLYIRPSWVVSKLFEKAPFLFMPGAKTMAYDLPEYLLTEKLKQSNRTLLFQMKYASPLLAEDSGRPTAFLSTGRMTRVAELNPNKNLSFI